MKELVVFGAGDIAELAQFYFEFDGGRKIAAFVVDDEFKTGDRFKNLPLIPFSQLLEQYPPARFDAFVALSYARMNAVRREKYFAMRALGYTLATYISPKVSSYTQCVGDNCFILEDNTIQPFSFIGNNVTLWSGNHIGHHSRIGDHCFLASHIVVSGGVEIGEGCFIGVNATLRDHIRIANGTLVGAGALITRDTKENEVYPGSSSRPAAMSSLDVKL